MLNSRTVQSVLLGAILAGLVLTGGASVAYASDDDAGDVGISVDVIGPSTVPSTPPVDPPRQGGSKGGAVTQQTITDPAAADVALGDEPFDLGGVLYVSGLTGSVSPSLGPNSGAVTLTLTVRNVSETTFDSKLRFWLDNAAGGEVDKVNGVKVKDLKPDETRTVSATMDDLGQWTLLHGHATITPPKIVEGTQLVPLTRDTTVVLAPLFSLSLAGCLAALGVGGWWLLGAHGLGLGKLVGLARLGA